MTINDWDSFIGKTIEKVEIINEEIEGGFIVPEKNKHYYVSSLRFHTIDNQILEINSSEYFSGCETHMNLLVIQKDK